ncbi:restriction endonuclease subunit S [Campylobacter pinnipediorum]|uniref:restriction endonuclease subunit S n=1 Tax=Campylobacter pinnipediorum TaxID=1965231 RepID=UPI0009AEC3F0|nr:restriction endonuclease subunit S [Campylobacter pinnipediorum]
MIDKDYKETKIGIIPKDWDIVRLGDICKFYKGKNISKKDLSDIGIPCIRYGELYTTYNETILKVYSKTLLNEECLFFSKINDVVIPSSGETAEEIAKASCVMLDNIALGGDLTILRTKENGVFLSYYINTVAKNRIARIAEGHSVVHLYASDLSNIQITLPKSKEQKKIVEILSLWDNAILKQSNLIDEKEKFKKGLMQRLLNAKIRFPEFKDEWKEVKLGDICKITTGKLNANSMIENGEYPFFTCAKEAYKINSFTFDTEALLISGNGANVGYIHYYNGKFNAYQRTYVLDNFKNNIFFVKYFLDYHLSFKILKEKNEGNVPYIKLQTLSKMKILLPNLTEQEKIANLLTLCDDEINLLKQELENLKEQKQGLMQKLLSGKVRV